MSSRAAPFDMTVRTDRLLLRPVQSSDARATAALITPDLGQILLSWPYPYSQEQARERIDRAIEELNQRTAVHFAIESRDEKRLLGWISLWRHGPKIARIGFWLGSEFQNRGLMKEAAAAAIPKATEFLGVLRVEAVVLPFNTASIRVLEAQGFRRACEELVGSPHKPAAMHLRYELELRYTAGSADWGIAS